MMETKANTNNLIARTGRVQKLNKHGKTRTVITF